MCTQWTPAKFKQLSTALVLSMLCSATGGGIVNCCTVSFSKVPPLNQTSLFQTYYLIWLFTLTHSWLAHLCPPPTPLKKTLVVPTVNLVISYPVLLYLSHTGTCTHIYTHMLFTNRLLVGNKKKIPLYWAVAMLDVCGWECMIRGRKVSLGRLWGAKPTLTFTGNGTFRFPLSCRTRLFA